MTKKIKYNQMVFGDNSIKDGWLRANTVMSIGNGQVGIYYRSEVTDTFKSPVSTILKFDPHNVIIMNCLILFALYNC